RMNSLFCHVCLERESKHSLSSASPFQFTTIIETNGPVGSRSSCFISNDVDFLRTCRQTLGGAITDDVSVLRSYAADTGEKDLGLNGHHGVRLERNVIPGGYHWKFVEFQPDAVSNELHLILAGAHELRGIGTFAHALQNARVYFSG